MQALSATRCMQTSMLAGTRLPVDCILSGQLGCNVPDAGHDPPSPFGLDYSLASDSHENVPHRFGARLWHANCRPVTISADCPDDGRSSSVRHLVLSAIAALVVPPAWAAPPPNPDPKLAPWYNSLRAPFTEALCCSIADCRPTMSRIRGGHYEAFIEGQWRTVPDDRVLNRTDNPTGHAVACWTPQAGIMCFVKAPES